MVFIEIFDETPGSRWLDHIFVVKTPNKSKEIITCDTDESV